MYTTIARGTVLSPALQLRAACETCSHQVCTWYVLSMYWYVLIMKQYVPQFCYTLPQVEAFYATIINSFGSYILSMNWYKWGMY